MSPETVIKITPLIPVAAFGDSHGNDYRIRMYQI